VLDPGRGRQSGPGLNGFGTGYRPPSGRGVPEPAGDCAPLSAGCPAHRMANSPAQRTPRIVSIRIRTRRPWACPHRPVLRAPARHLGGPPLSRGARSGAGAWLAAGVTGSSGWTQRSGSHQRRGRADTDAHDRRPSHADADHEKRCRGHGRGNDRVLTRTPATRSAGSCGGRTRRRWRPRSARSCATRCQRAGGCRGPGVALDGKTVRDARASDCSGQPS